MVTFGPKGSKRGFKKAATSAGAAGQKSLEEVVRQLKLDEVKGHGQEYRERALSIYGLICARCGREYQEKTRHLLTIHHRDGNHLNNPPDGSNWEPLCVYCHENTHSRELLGEYLGGKGGYEVDLVFRDPAAALPGERGLLGEKLKKALEKKK
jgi:hypothetical protein